MNLAGFTTTRPLRVWYCSVEGCSNAVKNPQTACGDSPMMVMVMEAALKTEDQVVSPTGMETADPEAPAPWTGQERRLVQAFFFVGYGWTAVDGCPLLEMLPIAPQLSSS